MDYIKLGNTGMDISPLALGCMTYGDPAAARTPGRCREDESRPLIRQAVEAGINYPSTRRTCTPTAPARKSWAGRWGDFTRRETPLSPRRSTA